MQPRDLTLPASAWESPLLRRWRDVFAAKSEAPPAFFYASAVFLVGLVVGHRVRFRYGLNLYLNWYLGLIGPTGVKKSTALEPMIRLARQVVPEVTQLHGLSTAEGLLQIHAKVDGGTVAVIESEIATLLAKTKRAESALMPTLCRLYDMPGQIDLPTRSDPITASKPFTSIIGASTAASIEHQIGEAEQLGGFLNRFAYFAGERQAANPWPGGASDDEWTDLVTDLEDISRNFSSVTWLTIPDPKAKRAWEAYYRDHYARQGKLPELLCALTGREHAHVIKFAMTFAVLRGDREINVDDIDRAVELGAYQFAVVESVVAPIGSSAASKIEGRIEALLTEGPMLRRVLAQRIGGRIKAQDLNRTLQSLIDMDRVIEFEGGTLGWDGAEYVEKLRRGDA